MRLGGKPNHEEVDSQGHGHPRRLYKLLRPGEGGKAGNRRLHPFEGVYRSRSTQIWR